jgi:hypothetical protein
MKGCLGLFAPEPPEEPLPPYDPRRRVLIIGIDGCRPDTLQRATTPHLRSLLREGAFSLKAQTQITYSGPSWKSMLIGYAREKRRVGDNAFTKCDVARHPHVLARLKAVHPEARTATIVNWASINERLLADVDCRRRFGSDAEVAPDGAQVLREADPHAVFVRFIADVAATAMRHLRIGPRRDWRIDGRPVGLSG